VSDQAGVRPVSRVAIVIGAAAGMGYATAHRFLDGGDRIAAWDVDGERLATAWTDADPDRVMTAAVDIADAEGVRDAVAAVLDRFGRVDVVVNNAALHGADWTATCLSLTPERWRRLLDVNVLGVVNVTAAAADALAATSGVVVNISSMTAYGHGPSSGYAVTKAAVNGLTTSFAEELGRRGVRVIGVAPGFVATETVLQSLAPDRPAAIMNLQSLPTWGEPADIACITHFLASPAARMITGQTVVADVGITRRP
jgi:NAD(P)-dependent dehydrogenase (short-subunit alcohol dehydrogenase family)